MNPRLPLKVLLPLAVLAAGLLLTSIMYFVSWRTAARQIEDLTSVHFVNVGHAYASSLQTSLRNRNLVRAQYHVQRIGGFEIAELGLLFDENDTVRFSSTQNLLGKTIADTPFAPLATRQPASRRSMRPVPAVSNDGKSMSLLIPLRLEPRPGELLSSRVGFLALQFDRAQWQAIGRRSATRQSLIYASLVFLLSVFAATLTRRLITNRVDRLVNHSRQIDVGQLDVEPVVTGQDEIAELSVAMANMANRLRDSANNLSLVIENSPNAIYLLDLDGTILVSNRRLLQWTGVSEHDFEEIGSQAIFSPAVAQELLEMDREVLDGQLRVVRQIALTVTTDSKRLLEVIKFPVTDAVGKLIGIGTIASDFTQHHEAELQLRHAQKMTAVGRLTGGIAHDFANILQVIVGNLELMRTSADYSSETGERLDNAIAATDSGKRLIGQLLAVSRKQVLQTETLNLNTILVNTRNLLRRTIGENIAIEMVNESELWRCESDMSLVENAILNLAVNARDAMPEGGALRFETANVLVAPKSASAETRVPPGEYVMLAVSDSGEGMSDAVREQAFEPFFTTKGDGKGNGLGLSTIYGFARQSKGHVTLESAPGQGTTVSIYLPRSGNGVEDGTTHPSQYVQNGSGETILLVEDNSNVRQTTGALLNGLGYIVHQAAGAAEALTYLQSGKPDAILSDVMMPGRMTGIQLARVVARGYTDVPVVLMSGHIAGPLDDTDEPEIDRHFLRKPFSLRDLSRVLRAVLSSESRTATG